MPAPADHDGRREEDTRTVDVLEYRSGATPTYRLVPAGKGEGVVAAHERELRKRELLRTVFTAIVVVAALGAGVVTDHPLVGAGVAAVVAVAYWLGGYDDEAVVPTVVDRNLFPRDAADRYDLGEGSEGE